MTNPTRTPRRRDHWVVSSVTDALLFLAVAATLTLLFAVIIVQTAKVAGAQEPTDGYDCRTFTGAWPSYTVTDEWGDVTNGWTTLVLIDGVPHYNVQAGTTLTATDGEINTIQKCRPLTTPTTTPVPEPTPEATPTPATPTPEPVTAARPAHTAVCDEERGDGTAIHTITIPAQGEVVWFLDGEPVAPGSVHTYVAGESRIVRVTFEAAPGYELTSGGYAHAYTITPFESCFVPPATPTPAAPAPTPEPECQEDEPCWDCETDGNGECEPDPTPTPEEGLVPPQSNDPRPPAVQLAETGVEHAGLAIISFTVIAAGIALVIVARRAGLR